MGGAVKFAAEELDNVGMTQPVQRVALGHDSSQLISVLAFLPRNEPHRLLNLLSFKLSKVIPHPA